MNPTRTSHGMSRRALLGWLAAAAVPASARVTPTAPEVADGLPGARLQGSGRLSVFGLHVYDIRLWVGEGFSAESFGQQPLAIEIEYARTLSGRKMAERSLDEMRRHATPSASQRAEWLAAMQRAFPDVGPGERLTGVHRPGASVRFFHNGSLRAEIDDPAFGPTFFAIWLSPKTSEPKLRLALLGSAA